MRLTPKHMKLLYASATVYALLMLIVRENGVVLIEVLGFGLPVLVFLAIEWVLPVAVAAIAGFQNKWSLQAAINAFPLVVVFAAISPFVSGKSTVLPTHLPWMAAAPSSISQAIEAIASRAPWWLLVYVIALFAGRFMRLTSSASKETDG